MTLSRAVAKAAEIVLLMLDLLLLIVKVATLPLNDDADHASPDMPPQGLFHILQTLDLPLHYLKRL